MVIVEFTYPWSSHEGSSIMHSTEGQVEAEMLSSSLSTNVLVTCTTNDNYLATIYAGIYSNSTENEQKRVAERISEISKGADEFAVANRETWLVRCCNDIGVDETVAWATYEINFDEIWIAIMLVPGYSYNYSENISAATEEWRTYAEYIALICRENIVIGIGSEDYGLEINVSAKTPSYLYDPMS